MCGCKETAFRGERLVAHPNKERSIVGRAFTRYPHVMKSLCADTQRLGAARTEDRSRFSLAREYQSSSVELSDRFTSTRIALSLHIAYVASASPFVQASGFGDDVFGNHGTAKIKRTERLSVVLNGFVYPQRFFRFALAVLLAAWRAGEHARAEDRQLLAVSCTSTRLREAVCAS